MLLFSLLLLLVNFCAIYGGDEERQGVYGLLQRLDREEAEEIYSFCLGLKRRSGFSQAKFGDDHHRISNGRPLDMTVGAYTALLYDPDLGSVQCTATFISWRHLVTAAHCIYLDLSHKTKLKLMAGGVHPPGHGDDMIELDYTVIVGFGNLPDEDKPGMETWEENFYIAQGDFAIIQLEESVPDYLKHDRIEIMCLPKANEAMPDKLNVYGFGLMSKDVQTDVLRGYTTRTNIVTSTMCEKSDQLVCQTTSFQNGCIMNADSGGGSWEFNGDDIRTIYAINTKIDDEQRSRCIVTGLRVSKVVHDICRYLDLCPAGADSTQAYLTAKMIYLTHERSWYSDIGWQLSYIPDEYNKLYEERCNKPYNETTVGPVTNYFSVLLNHGKPVCGATFITGRHLITSKICVRREIDSDGPHNSEFMIAAGGECIEVGEDCPEVNTVFMTIHAIVWDVSDTLEDAIAIIALSEDVEDQVEEYPVFENFTPTCIKRFSLDKPYPLRNYSVFNYGWTKEPAAHAESGYMQIAPKGTYAGENNCARREGTISFFVFCADGPAQDDSYVPGQFDVGNALLLMTEHGSYYGRYVRTIGIYQTIIDGYYVYTNMNRFLDVFCFYLNRCQSVGSTNPSLDIRGMVYYEHAWAPDDKRRRLISNRP